MKTIKVLTICFITLLCINSCSNTNTLKNDIIETDIAFKNSLTEKQIGKSNYYISLPIEYSIQAKDGEDFSVFYFEPKDTIMKASFRGGLYFGNFPHKFEPENDSCKIKNIKSNILAEMSEWTVYNCNGSYRVQTIIGSKSGDIEKIHAFGNASSESDMKKLLYIFSTLIQKRK